MPAPAPPPPPTPVQALQPIPSGVEPPPLSEAPTAARDAEIAAWIAGPVRGHDNRMAAMRRVTIRGTEGAYAITIDNQFGFHCALDFDERGTPSTLRNCRSREPDWHARPDTIALTCAIDGTDLECQASYQLSAQGGYSSREILLFRRHVI